MILQSHAHEGHQALQRSARHLLAFAAAIFACSLQCACNGGTGTTTTPPPISVVVTPPGISIFLGSTQTFVASVSGTTNSAVTWEVNSIAGGNPTVGQISSSGVYTAPQIMLASTAITITAASIADPAVTNSAAVTLKDDISIAVSPPSAAVPVSGAQVFTATIVASGSPSQAVKWSVNGIVGGSSTIGAIAPGANNTAVYTAPSVAPSPATVTIAAISVADATKSGTATATIGCNAAAAISPASASISLGTSQALTTSFCLAAGATVSWDVNGTAGGSAALGTITVTSANSALYIAPADFPLTNPLTLHAAASAVTSGPSAESASLTIVSNVSVSISPPSASAATDQRASFTATVAGTRDTAVSWFVNGIANGNATLGQICIAGSNPCIAPTAPSSTAIDFLAPAIAPNPNLVTITAISRADSAKSGVAAVTILGPAGPISVSLAPFYVFLVPSSSQPDTQQFFASVANSTNSAVTWSVQSAVSGQGCSGSACGTIDSSGLYTAPAAAPSPNAVTITATSQADNTKSASATVAINSGPTIEIIAPSSVMAGAVASFPLAVHGVNFVAGSAGSGSTILVNGAPRPTTCSNPGLCATTISPQDVASATTLTLEVQNPGSPGAFSNPVPFVVVPFDVSVGAIPLSSAAPTSTATDIVVTDPTTAATSSAINIESVGFITAGSNCGIQGSPLAIARPASGAQVASICIFGNGLDPAFTYTFSGPAAAPNAQDIGITASAVPGLLPGMIELDLTISSTTQPGVRALIVTTLNNDHAVGSGLLEIR